MPKIMIQNHTERVITLDWAVRDASTKREDGTERLGPVKRKGSIVLGSSLDARADDDSVPKPIALVNPATWKHVLETNEAAKGLIADGQITTQEVA